MFETEEKVTAFDAIFEKFYRRNFGQMSKADVEVLMFSIYIEQCLNKNLPYDDYTLANQLGISESRIRNLKVKKELQYPYQKFDWKKAFQECIRYAKYDDKKALVKVNVTDPNVRREIEHCIDQLNFYAEYQLNSKILQMRPDQFIILCTSLYSEEVVNGKLTEKGYETLETQLRKSKASEKIEAEHLLTRIREEGFRRSMESIAPAITKLVLRELLKAIPFGTVFTRYMDEFINNL